MSNALKGVLIFGAGCAIGAFVNNRLVKQKYEQMAQEEIDAVKKVLFKRAYKDNEDSEDNKPSTSAEGNESFLKEKPDLKDFVDYTKYSSDYKTEEEEVPEDATPLDESGIYIVDPETIEDADDIITLTLYIDGAVTDENDNIMSMTDVEETVGAENIISFGHSYDLTTLYVHNCRLDTYYEITKDNRNFADMADE